MMIDDLVEEYKKALKIQAEYNANEASHEDNRKIVLSEEIVKASSGPDGMAVTKAEHVARASQAYKAETDMLAKARSLAEVARADVEYIRVRFEAWRTKMSMAKVVRQTNG